MKKLIYAVLLSFLVAGVACDEPEESDEGTEEEQEDTEEEGDDEEAEEAEEEEAAQEGPQELAELGVSAVIPEGSSVGDAMMSDDGVTVDGGDHAITIDVPEDDDAKDMEESKRQAEEFFSAENMEVTELDDGWILSYTNEGGAGTNYWVTGYRDIDGNEVSCAVTSGQEIHQTTGVEFCESLQ